MEELILLNELNNVEVQEHMMWKIQKGILGCFLLDQLIKQFPIKTYLTDRFSVVNIIGVICISITIKLLGTDITFFKRQMNIYSSPEL